MATGDTVLTDESLTRRPEGLGIALTVPWYRSLWLSSVSGIAVAVGGRPVPAEDLRVELAGRTYTVAELPEQWDTLWFIQDRLVVVVPLDEPAAEGAEVDVEVTVDLRLPYMQIAPVTYVPTPPATRPPLGVHGGARPIPPPAPPPPAAPAVPGCDIKLGLTLYSLTSEWAAGRYDLPGLL